MRLSCVAGVSCVSQYVAACYSVLQCVAGVLQCAYCRCVAQTHQIAAVSKTVMCRRCVQCVAVCCSVLQCVAVCCSVSQVCAVCHRVSQHVAAYCSVLQRVAGVLQ